MPTVVACLGSSSTAAKGSYDWIADLRGRPENAAMTLLNFGVGGDLAFNALERLPAILRMRPDKLVVLVGGNDILTRASTKLKRFLGTWKRLPREPSAAPDRAKREARRCRSSSMAKVGHRRWRPGVRAAAGPQARGR
jgi:lysophospholipase L1-like esterase